MFAMLPALHEDQTLYSWCGLTHALNGSGCARTTSTRLFGAPYAALIHDFPSHLIELANSTQGMLGHIEDVALRNTLLGYYLAIVRQPKAEQIIGLLKSGTIRHLKMSLGITASRVGGHHPLKGCEKCVAEDEYSQGGAYWHIEHQLPSVFVCTKHCCPLFLVWDSVTPVHRRFWLLPQRRNHYSTNEIVVESDTAMRCLLRLAIDSARLMRLRPGALEPEHLTRGYQLLLQEAGLATRKGVLRIARIVSIVKERYRGLEDLPGMAPLRAIDGQWPGLAASLSRRSSRAGHPLKHLLLIGAISESWDQFTRSCSVTAPLDEPAQRALTHTGTSSNRLDLFKELVTNHGKSLAAASASLGVSRTTGSLWAQKLKITYTSRGQPIAKSTSSKIRILLLKGHSISDIATTTGVSMTTVYRIAGTNPDISQKRRANAFDSRQAIARSNFSTICRTQSDQSLKVIRAMPGNSYMWLYRNDHQWLTKKLREQGRFSTRSR